MIYGEAVNLNLGNSHDENQQEWQTSYQLTKFNKLRIIIRHQHCNSGRLIENTKTLM